ncbi:MAG: hypothetical protein NTW96_03175 [Planctomycetia bacterium]|nr:hypothetical protein [Planctomycetia bacterium]
MFALRYTIVLVLIGLGLAGGCQSAPWSADGAAPGLPAAARSAPAPFGAAPGVPPPPVPDAASAPSRPTPRQIMAEAHDLGASDPEAQARLLAELRDSDPSLWPLVLESFRARLAYARQARQNETSNPREAAPVASNQAPAAEPSAPAMAAATSPTASVARLPVPADTALPPAAAPEGPYPQTREPGPTEILTRRPSDARPAAPPRADGVVRTSYAEDSPEDWRGPLSEAIAMLESAGGGEPGAKSDVVRQARLRLLLLAAGRRDEALEPIRSADAAASDFWSNEFFGLNVLLTPEEIPQEPRRAAEAKRRLAGALDSLGETAALEVRNLAFCSDVQSYGAVKRFDKYEFSPGQRLLLYAEIDNFKSEETPRGYHTSLRSSYQIFDAAGRRVDQQESTATEEHCANPRRDYFLGCDFHLPKQIYPGEHTLKLTVEDLKSRKVGESSITFTIK